MRNLREVLRQIIPLVENRNLEIELEDNLDSLMYAAPEMQSFWWREVHNNIASTIFPPKLDWEWQVLSIWLDRSEVDLKAELSSSSSETE